MSKDEIRKHFTDYRYLKSWEEPDVLREFVRYDEVLSLIEKIQKG